MQKTISPARCVQGSLLLPGDKSISHRYAILASIAEGDSRLHNFSTGADCQSTLNAMRALGVEIEKENNDVTVRGRGLDSLREPSAMLDAGNSGSTIRMLSGILAAQPFNSEIGGDESLSRRPMGRIMEPLATMGARVEARDGRYPPLTIHGTPNIQPLDYTLPVPSAQVKTCVLFAGCYAHGETIVREAIRSRDHSEIALREFGADISVSRRVIRLQGRAKLTGREMFVPSDLSSAAFFLVAALILPGSELQLRGVGLNPTRSTLLDFLVSTGADIRILKVEEVNGELVGEIAVRHSIVQGGVIDEETTAALIDEIPVLAVLGARSENGITIRDAGELRIKETDRIETVVENFRRMGVHVDEFEDGMHIPGKQTFRPAAFDSFGDHRIAMAFAVAALAAGGESQLDNAEAASVSFPEFYGLLDEARMS